MPRLKRLVKDCSCSNIDYDEENDDDDDNNMDEVDNDDVMDEVDNDDDMDEDNDISNMVKTMPKKIEIDKICYSDAEIFR